MVSFYASIWARIGVEGVRQKAVAAWWGLLLCFPIVIDGSSHAASDLAESPASGTPMHGWPC
jgi:hypothetical protein